MLRFPFRTRGLTVGLLTFLYGMGVHSQAPPTALPPDPLIFVGSGPGGGMAGIFQANGTPVVSVPPFGGGFTGGIRVAAGDINGDGITDVVAGMASGGGQVRAFNGLDGTTLGTSTPFGAGFTGGVFLATGDVNGDGHDDLLLGAGQGSGLARLIDGATQTELGSGLPFPVAYTGGVAVAMGDVTGDGRADLIFGTAIGGFVRVFDGPTLTELASGFRTAAGARVQHRRPPCTPENGVPSATSSACRLYTRTGPPAFRGASATSSIPSPFTSPAATFTPPRKRGPYALADLNADGRDDLVMGAGAPSFWICSHSMPGSRVA